VLTLVKKEDRWLIRDSDLETEESVKDEMKRFIDKHPDAKPVPEKIKDAKAGEKKAPVPADLLAARDAAAAFLRAVADNRIEDASALMTDPYRKDKPQGLRRLEQTIDLKDVTILENSLSTDGTHAAIVTSQFKLRGRDQMGALGLGLVREKDRWLVRDLDALSTLESREQFMAEFRQARGVSQSATRPASPR
jgi:hypothetical protein